MGLQEQAILVSLSIKTWSARKNDKETTQEILFTKGAKANSGNFSKRLLSKEYVQKYLDIASSARDYHKTMTMPWTEGKGMLSMKFYQQYVEKMNDFKDQFEYVVHNEFIPNYASYIDLDKDSLNGLHRIEDYPTQEKIAKKFGFSVEFEPIPDTNDLRISMSSSEREELKKSIESHLKDKQVQAMTDLWRRLYDCVSNMHKVLSNDKGKVHDSLLEKVIDLTELLPDMNLMEDQKLEQMRQEVVSKLCTHDISDLRKDKVVRSQVASDAKALSDAMVGYLGEDS